MEHIKVTKTVERGSIVSFTLVDDRGTRYVFGDYETTNVPGDPMPSGRYTSSWYISKIVAPTGESVSFPNGVIARFYYDDSKQMDRSSLNNNPQLDRIELSDGKSTRGFALLQDYSTNRWTLRGVEPYTLEGGLRLREPGYSMEYYGSLPERLSYSQDHWGFYNRNTGGSLIPTDYLEYKTASSPIFTIPGGNRDTDPDRVKNGSLTRISYPTGGSTSFEMEANRAVHNWLDQRFDASYWTQQDKIGHEYLSIYDNVQYPNNAIVTTYNGSLSNINVTIEVSPIVSSGTINVEAYIESGTGWQYRSMGTVTMKPNTSSAQYFTATFGLGGLSAGKKIKFVGYGQGNNFSSMVHLYWKEGVEDVKHTNLYEHKQPYVGGLRVKTVTNYSGPGGDFANKSVYEYLEDDNATSSGALGTYPVYSYMLRYSPEPPTMVNDDAWTSKDPTSPWGFPNYYIQSSSTVYSIVSYNGSPVTYGRIKKTMVDREGRRNGYTVYDYTSFKESAPAIYTYFPFVPPAYLKWGVGLLKSEQVFDGNGTLREETSNTYNNKLDNYTSDQSRYENFRCISMAPIMFSRTDITGYLSVYNPNQSPYVFVMQSYYPIAGNEVLTGSVSRKYSQDGSGKYVEERHDYAYDATQQYLLRDDYTDSRSVRSSLRNSYVYDVQQPGSLLQQMKEANMLALPVGTEHYKNQQLLQRKQVTYGSPHAGFFAPSKIDFFTKSSLSHTLLYNFYGSNGNVQEQQKVGDVKEVYLWGYNSQYPVAKVVGSSYDVVSSRVSQAVLDNPSSDGAMRSELDKVRDAFKSDKGVQVWTYTYKPLEGMTSETDPKGATTYYEYDGFGRLMYAKDRDGNVIKKYDYHYAGQ